MRIAMILIGCVGVLAGCAASPAFDFDLTCTDGPGWSDGSGIMFMDDPIQYFACHDKTNDFYTGCDRATVQEVNGVFYCSTKDKKSVRVRLQLNEEEVKDREYLKSLGF